MKPSEMLTLADKPVSWCVPDFIADHSLIVLAGEPGQGKSTFSYNLSVGLAGGLEVLGKPTTASRVLYFDQENSFPDACRYLQWAWYGHEQKPDLSLLDTNLRIDHFTLGGANWAERMRKAAQEFRPRLIIVDTATPAFAIAKEEDNGEAARAITKLRGIQAEFQTALLILKHEKIRDVGAPGGTRRRTIRGAKTWEGSPDGFVFYVKRPGRPGKDGLSRGILEPGKVRAYGLRKAIGILPTFTHDGRGLHLAVEPAEAP